MPQPSTPSTLPHRLRRKITAYVALTKPRVIELLLVITAPVMILAAQGGSATSGSFSRRSSAAR